MKTCTSCSHSITSSWLFFSGRRTKYVCPNCETKYEFTDTHLVWQTISLATVAFAFVWLSVFLKTGVYSYPLAISLYFLIISIAPQQYEQVSEKLEKLEKRGHIKLRT